MGTVQIDGSTPKITVGNATAEDATILFDGNAQDFYIALDDSADDLLIGLGSTVGTTPAIAIDENLKVNIPVTTASTSTSTGSLTTGGGAGIGADLYVGDDAYLITDSAVLGFGADKDTLLTHTDGTGLTLNSTNKLCFNDTGTYVGSNADGDIDVVSDGTAADSINLESAGGITLDAGVAATGVTYEDDGTAMLSITNSSSDVVLTSKVQDKDIIFKGDDGGSAITALTIDMSDGGILQTRAGVGFPATQIASSGANVLDDYEEGDWTIAVQDANDNAMSMTSDTTGSYTKIGNKVYISGHFSTSSLGSASGDVRLYGLPYAATSGNKTVGGATIHWGAGLAITAGHVIAAYVQPSSSFVSLRLWDATTGVTALQTGEWTADGASTIGGFYTTA